MEFIGFSSTSTTKLPFDRLHAPGGGVVFSLTCSRLQLTQEVAAFARTSRFGERGTEAAPATSER